MVRGDSDERQFGFFSELLVCGVREKIPFLPGERAFSNYSVVQRIILLSKWDITNDANGNISMKSPYDPFGSEWVGYELKGSTSAVSWRLIPAKRESYY